MNGIPVYLREFNIVSVAVRLALAMTAGGILGWGRSRKNRAAVVGLSAGAGFYEVRLAKEDI